MPRFSATAFIVTLIIVSAPSVAQQIDDNASVDSPGGKKIISALFHGQVAPAGQPELSEPEIAALKTGTGWGKLFQQLKLQGRFPEYRNLGDLISSRNRLERAAHTGSNSLQRTSRSGIRPDRPNKPTRIEKFSRPERPDKPHRR